MLKPTRLGSCGELRFFWMKNASCFDRKQTIGMGRTVSTVAFLPNRTKGIWGVSGSPLDTHKKVSLLGLSFNSAFCCSASIAGESPSRYSQYAFPAGRVRRSQIQLDRPPPASSRARNASRSSSVGSWTVPTVPSLGPVVTLLQLLWNIEG